MHICVKKMDLLTTRDRLREHFPKTKMSCAHQILIPLNDRMQLSITKPLESIMDELDMVILDGTKIVQNEVLGVIKFFGNIDDIIFEIYNIFSMV